MLEKGLVIVSISADKFPDKLSQNLEEYSDAISEDMQRITDVVAKEGVKKLKNVSPKGTGVYAKSWSMSKRVRLRRTTENIIHNRKKYQLTHLLEKGHVGRDGKRVRAIPHIEPVEKELIKKFEIEVERSLRDAR